MAVTLEITAVFLYPIHMSQHTDLPLYQIDPEGRETAVLLEYADFSGKRVLEIGCGNGRLTWQYAHLAAHVTAIDPSGEKIAQAIAETPPQLQDSVTFWAGGIDEFETTEQYDLALFSWSL